MKSDKECTASASMAALCPMMPAKELEQKQQEVHYAPHNRYAVNAFFPRNLFLIHRLYFHDVFSKLLQI